jgi:glucose/arabinose dehydrogenase
VIPCLALAFLLWASSARAVTLPSGFQDTVVLKGMVEPTNVRFAPDGRIFVAEKSGKIEVYEGLEDETPTLFADLRTEVFNYIDRGLLGLALDPEFPTKPYVYALYTYDHELGSLASPPRWGTAGQDSDECPDPPGADTDGCVASGRLVRLTAEGDHAAPSAAAPAQDVLVEGWCQQFSTHSIGDLQFGPEGALYASGGEGAGWLYADYGQAGNPKNPCGDPPAGVGGTQEPPEAEGGALRAQDVRTPGDPTGLSGTVIRIDPETGEGLPENPFAASSDANARRIVAYGFRNPFRFAIDPETHEVYVGNVGWNTYEEIDRFNSVPSPAYNSGWPCYEGPAPEPEYEELHLNICESLYETPGAASMPFFSYLHSAEVVPGDPCPNLEGSAVSGMTVYRADDFPGVFPASYDGAFFFADAVRGCIWVMFPGEDGRPDPSTIMPFLTHGGLYPGVEIEVGPEGDLYYLSLFSGDYEEGELHRISYSSGNQPPVAHLKVDHEYGATPLHVEFDASESEDADGDPLTYEWDLNDDGTFEELGSNDDTTSQIYNDSTNHTVAVKVKDPSGASSVDRVTIYPGDTPPEPTIVAPSPSFEWSVGEQVEFEGEASDNEDGTLPSTSLDWSARLAHCPNLSEPTACHTHQLPAFPAVDSGSFAAPDHGYPSHIDLMLKATDSRGLTATTKVQLDPQIVQLSLLSEPPGLTLNAGFVNTATPFEVTAIKDSHISISAPQSQELGGSTYEWSGWSDSGARVHTVTASGASSYKATYQKQGPTGGGGGSEPEKAGPPSPLPAPQTTLRKHPPKRTGSRVASFSFSSDESGSSFRCKLDRGAFKSCRSPVRYKRLKPGGHLFQVAATNAEGKADASPVKFRWTVHN